MATTRDKLDIDYTERIPGAEHTLDDTIHTTEQRSLNRSETELVDNDLSLIRQLHIQQSA